LKLISLPQRKRGVGRKMICKTCKEKIKDMIKHVIETGHNEFEKEKESE